MKRIIAVVCAAVASALSAAGCGTVDNMCFENPRTNQVPMHVYGGLEADVRYLSEDDSHGKGGVDPLKVVYLADLPLSLVADTATLPVTLPMACVDRLSHRSNPLPKVPPQTGGATAPNAPPPPSPPVVQGGAADNPNVPPGFTPENH